MKDTLLLGDSIWAATASVPTSPELTRDVAADVCIVGAGIAGMTTAYLLGRAGKAVVIVEDGQIASGQTHLTTAHLSNAIDDRYVEIERMHGAEGARLAAQSHSAAIDRIEAIVREEGVDCDFERLDGYLFAPTDADREVLEREYDAARRTEVVEVEWVPRAPWEHFDTGPCLRFRAQGQFHPLAYLSQLAAAIRRDGGRIYGNTHVKSVEGGSIGRVETSRGPVVTADAVVVATNTPINDLIAIHTKQAPYRTYVIGAGIRRGAVPHALYWDTLDPYHYVRLQAALNGGESPMDREILVVGGEDHKSGQIEDTEHPYTRLEAWARQRFPDLEGVAYRWTGQVMESFDGLAFIGRNPLDKHNVFIATGDSGMGMTHGTIAGMLLSDLILGKDNPWARLYDPSRKTLRSLGEFAKENLNVAGQYAKWLTPGEVKSVDEIAPGQGAIVRRGLTKIAAYRDAEGRMTERSAVCTHLGCVVDWNPSSRTWDCPCHGSQFDPFGKVINGPANRDLPPVEAGVKTRD